MRRILFLLVLATVLTAFTAFAGDYARLARISYLDGNVSFMHPNEVEWSAASINMPLQVADRIYTGADGKAEIEFDDGSVIRLAERTDIEVLSLKDDLIQVRILVGLASLDLRSGIGFEIDTPAAAFNAVRKGSYRFDVAENGDSDGIVRRGVLEAANDKISRKIESGQVIHVVAGESATYTVSRYQSRDGWDEWNDRRNADMVARSSRSYVPDTVYMGVSDLDRYGRWVSVVDYGPAWIPSYVDPMWSPYWSGRWCYRPMWGWTWVSYEPWGWLPYHYGRWYHHNSFGWCWLPGASFGFNFWSPGLVRFYHGPDWVSWAPLGPGDYYNVNNYYYNGIYTSQLNQLRILQHRSADSLFNQNVPGAFRTVRTEQFVQNSFGPSSRGTGLADIDKPWIRGRMVADRLNVEPNAQSYAPAPDRRASRPEHTNDRMPVVVRTQPVAPDPGARFIRANPVTDDAGRRAPEVSREGSGIGRRTPDTGEPARAVPGGRILQTPSATPRTDTMRNPERNIPNRNERTVNPTPETPGRNVDPGSNRGREVPSVRRPDPGSQPVRRQEPPATPPVRRPEPSAAPPRVDRQPEARPTESRPRPKDPPESMSYNDSRRSGGGVSERSSQRPSYYSREEGWVRSVPNTSRGDVTVSRFGNSPAVREQPAYTSGYARQEQPSYQRGVSPSRSSDYSGAREAARSAPQSYYPQQVTQEPSRAPRSWGESSYPTQGRQYSSPAPERGGYFGGGPSFGRPGGYSEPGRMISTPSGGGRNWGSMGAPGGMGGEPRSGGAVLGGRRK